MKKKTTVAHVLAILCMLNLLLSGCATETPAQNPQTQSGRSGVLQSFEAETLDGETFTGEDIAKKDVTILNFWSVTCGPCIDELPNLAKLAESLPENVQLLSVCLDGGLEAERAAQILEEAGFVGTTLIGGNGDLSEIVRQIQYTPTTILVDKEGNLVGEAIIGGQRDPDVYTAAIDAALESMGTAGNAQA